MNEFADRLRTPLQLALLLLIAWTLANGAWFFLGGAETDVGATSAPVTRSGPAERSIFGAREIAALDLFGSAEGGDALPLDAPETRLQLELHGVFLAGRDDASSAIVAERNRDGKLYFIGDNLPGNAELLRILEDRIVLRRGGTVETLRFPDGDTARGFATGDAPLPDGPAIGLSAARERSQRPNRLPFDDDLSTDTASSAAPTGGSIRELVDSYRSRLEDDPDATLRELGVQSVQIGESHGYRVGSEASSADLARIGLRAGDVVLSVNGRDVTELQRDPGAVDGIVESGSARLEIQRGERRFFVTTRIPEM